MEINAACNGYSCKQWWIINNMKHNVPLKYKSTAHCRQSIEMLSVITTKFLLLGHRTYYWKGEHISIIISNNNQRQTKHNRNGDFFYITRKQSKVWGNGGTVEKILKHEFDEFVSLFWLELIVDSDSAVFWTWVFIKFFSCTPLPRPSVRPCQPYAD